MFEKSDFSGNFKKITDLIKPASIKTCYSPFTRPPRHINCTRRYRPGGKTWGGTAARSTVAAPLFCACLYPLLRYIPWLMYASLYVLTCTFILCERQFARICGKKALSYLYSSSFVPPSSYLLYIFWRYSLYLYCVGYSTYLYPLLVYASLFVSIYNTLTFIM